MNVLKLFYKARRYAASYFTYDCASCGKTVRGSCLCKDCVSKMVPFENKIPGCAHAYYYAGPAKELMLRYKFGEDFDYCKDMLCLWLLDAFRNFKNEKIDFAVSVPAFSRKKTRLYYLAKEFCALADIPFAPSVLKKIRSTEKQHSLPGKERRHNLTDAFEADFSVFGKTILLIDDIYTTGSTVFECSKALYQKGAAKVLVLTMLKTDFPD